MILSEAGKAFLLHCRLERHLSPNTLAAYRQDVVELVGHFGPVEIKAVTGDALVAYVAYLSGRRGLAPATVKRRLACTRSLFRWLMRTGVLAADPFTGTEIRVRIPDRLPRCLTTEEMARLARAADAAAPLTRLATLLLFATGMRVGELVSIRLGDIDLDRDTIRIMGKGNRQRQVVIPNGGMKDAIRNYIRAHHLGQRDVDCLLTGSDRKTLMQ